MARLTELVESVDLDAHLAAIREALEARDAGPPALDAAEETLTGALPGDPVAS